MKQAKIAIIVVCLLIGAFLIYRSVAGGGAQLPGNKRLVNILTGEVSSMDLEKLSVIPYPDSEGRRVLYPATRNDSGTWTVDEDFRSRILTHLAENQYSENDLAISLETFEVQK